MSVCVCHKGEGDSTHAEISRRNPSPTWSLSPECVEWQCGDSVARGFPSLVVEELVDAATCSHFVWRWVFLCMPFSDNVICWRFEMQQMWGWISWVLRKTRGGGFNFHPNEETLLTVYNSLKCSFEVELFISILLKFYFSIKMPLVSFKSLRSYKLYVQKCKLLMPITLMMMLMMMTGCLPFGVTVRRNTFRSINFSNPIRKCVREGRWYKGGHDHTFASSPLSQEARGQPPWGP